MDLQNDESDLVYRALDVETRSMDVERRSIDFVCSTSGEDRYGEIVEQSWKLDNYQRNPVVLYAHRSRDILPIGKAENMRVTRTDGRDRLECTVVFASEKANPMAEQVFQLCREGILKAVSVGFLPKTIRSEMRDGKDVTVLADNELCELSVTPVPANPEALAKHLARARLDPPAPPAANDNEMGADAIEALTAKAAEVDAVRLRVADLETALEEKDAEVAARDAQLVERDTRIATLEGELANKDLEIAQRDANLAEVEVDALIGKKILPIERDAFLELKKINPALFQKMTAGRDLKLLGGSVLAADPAGAENGVAKGGADHNGSDMAKRAQEKARAKVTR